MKIEYIMPAAARIGDVSTHGGSIVGPGVPTVLIAGMPAATIVDLHVCVLPPTFIHPPVSPFVGASSTVLIGGLPALRAGDMCVCGASTTPGAPTVMIG